MWREVPWVKDLPSEYVNRHFRLTTAPAHLPPDAAGRAQLLEMLGGAAMLAYASDFPHDHGDSIAPLLSELPAAARRGAASSMTPPPSSTTCVPSGRPRSGSGGATRTR